MGGEVRKQYLPLAGQPILTRTLNVFSASGFFEEIILVVDGSEIAYCRREVIEKWGLGLPCRLVAGGSERQESVYNGLSVCSVKDDDPVLIHDGVRPFVSKECLQQCLQAVEKHGACIAGVPSCDTLKKVNKQGGIRHTLPRDAVWMAQTPQGFRLGLIRAAHEKAREDGFVGTDDAQLLERLGHAVAIVPGSRANIKITTPDDLRFAETIWQSGLYGDGKTS